MNNYIDDEFDYEVDDEVEGNNSDDISEIDYKVSKLADIKKQIEMLNIQKEELEGYFLKLAGEDLKNTKKKTTIYNGRGGRIVATMAESLKIVYPVFLKNIFGEAYPDAVKEDIKYKLSAPAVRMLTGMYLKSYTKLTVTEVLAQIQVDDKTRKALIKKVKGTSFENDKSNLIAIGGLSEQSAEEYAFFISEAAIWESFLRILKLSGCSESDEQKYLDWINGAVVVEEIPKIALEIY